MNKVITINLNGRAFQLEEGGFNQLSKYLEEAKAKLMADPDKDEIVADLEQAVAEKFARFLQNGKDVVMDREVDEVLKEMGPVRSTSENHQQTENNTAPKPESEKKRFYRIKEGAMLGGVCNGLAAYFNWDVAWVRVITVLLGVLSHGLLFLAYIIMWIVVPKADTARETAKAYGQPFTAQELVNRARAEYAEFAGSQEVKKKQEYKNWKREFKQQMREERRKWRQQRHIERGPLHPLFGLLGILISVAWVYGIITLATQAMVFGFAVPAGMPIWVAILVWVCLYSFVMWPIKAARYSMISDGQGNYHRVHHGGGIADFIVVVAFWALAIWALWHFVPGSHPYFQKIGLWWEHVSVHYHLK